VTIADREAERIIASRLVALLPGSRIIGEEAAAEMPPLLNDLDQGDFWLVDPLDGTANFVAGTPEFCGWSRCTRQFRQRTVEFRVTASRTAPLIVVFNDDHIVSRGQRGVDARHRHRDVPLSAD